MAASNLFTALPGGAKFPLLGLGTWQSEKGKVRAAVETAIECGYRHIDAAYIYSNESEVGEGIKTKMTDGTIKREDLFVTTKLWISAHKPDKVEPCCRESMKNLGLDYIDLYLIHWPMSLVDDKGVFPLGEDGMLIGNDSIDYVDVWKSMESLVDKGLVRAIGVCNFNQSQIQRVLDLPPRHPIANLQVECHPLLAQNELIELCKKHGITVTAYSPLGSPERPGKRTPTDPVLMEDKVVLDIAKKRGVSTAQVLIRYQIQRGVVVIPKSVTSSRIQQNFEALNFELSKEEMQALVDLNRDYRFLDFPMSKSLKYYPF
ncbi:aldo-keto reductase family 1 member B1-like [Lytechinus variegatus]|uniref:aldo-keto reductase family 1 member B1-like n=1 Tax=Lytechinus variegatus TaxID=7654 RepID=UPI001BB2899D|nr:aldo-keto reductase family 1 member B1-like [Lytechinus variegatus]